MTALASLLLGASVTLLTTALLQLPRASSRVPQFVEDERVPRTLH